MPLHGFSNVSALDTSAQNAHSTMVGFDDFLKRHTGEVNSPDDIFCINKQGIIVNNMHYEIALNGYSPNGIAVTEAQALLVQGYIWLFNATKDKKWLDLAEFYFDAHVKYYYGGTPIPEKPRRWQSHWSINGKEPFRTLGPVNYQDPSKSGVWDVPVQFTNGVGYVPAGAPYYGEQLARVYKVYSGPARWDNVTAGPAAGGTSYNIDFFVDDRKYRMNWDGDEIDDAPQNTYPTRYLKLVENYTGELNISFSCRSGLIIDRNKAFESWPMWQHVEKPLYGNAGDAEEWFAETCFMLFEATGNRKYMKAFDASMFTLWESCNLPNQSLMFMHDTQHISTTPFTEGISYWWDYTTNADATCVRDPNTGYIRIEKTEELFAEDRSQVAIEQMALINRVTPDSYVRMELGVNLTVENAFMSAFIRVSPTLVEGSGVMYRTPMIPNNSIEPTVYELRLGSCVAFDDGNEHEYVMLTGQSFIQYNNATVSTSFRNGILGDSRRNDYAGRCDIPDGSSGVVLGFWGALPSVRPLQSLTYRYLGANQLVVSVTDALGWKWEWPLPYSTDWVTVDIAWSALQLSANQNNTGPLPSAPAQFDTLAQVQITTASDADFNMGSSIEFYCYGPVPPVFTGTGYMNHFKWLLATHDEFVCNIGNVEVLNTVEMRSKYTPGVIPFSTNYSKTKGKVEFYRGTPYTGYVYATQWLMGGHLDAVQNCIDYWYDAMVDYKNRFGFWGLCAPIYIWPRWDNIQDGPAETFVYIERGDENSIPWGGYYSRTFYAAAVLWKMMHERGMEVPDKLKFVCEQHINYLADFMDKNDDMTPTEFPKPGAGIPYNPGNSDHTAHMTAHWMCGAIFMKMIGSTNPLVERVIEGCVREFERTYVIQSGDYKHMSGSWSSWYGGNYFYGFWAGEIIRAMAILMIYRDWQRRTPAVAVLDQLQDMALEDNTGMIALEDNSGHFVYDNPMTFDLHPEALLQEDNIYEIKSESDDTAIGLEPI